jgi:hypothetical protein
MRRLKRKKKLTDKDHAQLRRLSMIARDHLTKPQAARPQRTSNGRDSFLRSLTHEPQTPVAESHPEPTPTPEPTVSPTAHVPQTVPEPQAAPTAEELDERQVAALACVDRLEAQLAERPSTLADEARAAFPPKPRVMHEGPSSSAAMLRALRQGTR